MIATAKISQLEKHGYILCGYFNLDPSSWIDTYYKPLEDSFEAFLDRHEHAKNAVEVIEEYRFEIDQYQEYKEFFSYGFYIAKKLN